MTASTASALAIDGVLGGLYVTDASRMTEAAAEGAFYACMHAQIFGLIRSDGQAGSLVGLLGWLVGLVVNSHTLTHLPSNEPPAASSSSTHSSIHSTGEPTFVSFW